MNSCTRSGVLTASLPRSSLTSNLCCSAALSERRGIINPRRGWQPCVAPYFADLGVGDMRGLPMGAPKMPPRRWWQTVIAPHDPMSHTRDTQHVAVARNTMVEATACHHLRGGDLGGTPPRPPRMSPRPRVAKYGATHGCNPSRGSGNVRLLSSSPTSTACACRSTHSRVLAATPPLHHLYIQSFFDFCVIFTVFYVLFLPLFALTL